MIYTIVLIAFLVLLLFSVIEFRLKSNESFPLQILKSIVGSILLIIPFYYMTYYALGNWPIFLTVIYITINILWPISSMYSYITGHSIIEKYILTITYYFVPIILVVSSNHIIPKNTIGLLIMLDFLLGIILWIFNRAKNKRKNI